MVQPSSSRPRRRTRHAGPSHPDLATEAAPQDEPLDPVLYPNLAAQREMDREEHVRRARAMGLTREQAERHADEHLAGRHD